MIKELHQQFQSQIPLLNINLLRLKENWLILQSYQILRWDHFEYFISYPD